MPAASKIAARVEGRSKQARLGMTAHITAPTIHAGFAGKITLEIKNFGPFYLKVTPNDTRLCQLVFESVVGMPIRDASKSFKNQETTLGSPKPKKKVNERAFASKAIITLQRRRFRFRTVFHDADLRPTGVPEAPQCPSLAPAAQWSGGRDEAAVPISDPYYQDRFRNNTMI